MLIQLLRARIYPVGWPAVVSSLVRLSAVDMNRMKKRLLKILKRQGNLNDRK